jgi:hypothetical protein
MKEACDLEMFQRISWVQVFYPPGGTPRLHGRQDARRYGKATECANTNMNCHSFAPHMIDISALTASHPRRYPAPPLFPFLRSQRRGCRSGGEVSTFA